MIYTMSDDFLFLLTNKHLTDNYLQKIERRPLLNDFSINKLKKT